MEDQPHQLDYAPGAPVRRARRTARVMWAAALAVMGVVLFVTVPGTYEGLMFERSYRYLMNNPLPAGEVAYPAPEEVDPEIERLLRHGEIFDPLGLAGERLFLGPRENRHGGRLVSVAVIGPVRLSGSDMIRLDIYVGVRAAWGKSFSLRIRTLTIRYPGAIDAESFDMKLFTGEADPDDPSHFTIRYEIEAEEGIIDGWLMDDDSVRLEVRQGTPANPR